jgi:membrane-associated protease RseP (regulator of RpoE activity)
VDLPEQPEAGYYYFEPPRRFQHRYWLHAAFFLATLASTTYVGRFWGAELSWVDGLAYSLPILAILTAHEFGHYVACRIHQVDATLPYYIPAPFLPLTGTLGAVIKIREPFPHKRALFDIGVAGPIAGFVMLLPFLWWGVAHSDLIRADHSTGIWLGEPLLLKFFKWLSFGPLGPDADISIHPVGFAAWFGMLATSLNLLPFGQLDGGHLAYAYAGRRARFVSMGTLTITLLLCIQSLSWLAMAIMMAAMAVFLGFGHPTVIDEDAPLDRRRTLVLVAAIVIFALCFTPVPIEVLFEG